MFRRITQCFCFIFFCSSIICIDDVARDYMIYRLSGSSKAL